MTQNSLHQIVKVRSHNGSVPFVIPAVLGGYPSLQTQDGFPITNVGNDSEREIPAARFGVLTSAVIPASSRRGSIRKEPKIDFRYTLLGRTTYFRHTRSFRRVSIRRIRSLDSRLHACASKLRRVDTGMTYIREQ